ncbi:hypothetical protein Slala03_21100 [Streptomyces lavendulae subsp. lavendulae]|nr:hypothetical protein Slala03_21100 [Streptomyces lavendulae subsp. lavendulae]
MKKRRGLLAAVPGAGVFYLRGRLNQSFHQFRRSRECRGMSDPAIRQNANAKTSRSASNPTNHQGVFGGKLICGTGVPFKGGAPSGYAVSVNTFWPPC